jgi:hypothetical protein
MITIKYRIRELDLIVGVPAGEIDQFLADLQKEVSTVARQPVEMYDYGEDYVVYKAKDHHEKYTLDFIEREQSL